MAMAVYLMGVVLKVNFACGNYMNRFIDAVRTNNIFEVEMLLETTNVLDEIFESDHSLLHDTIDTTHFRVKMAQLLISKGAGRMINRINVMGNTPLISASFAYMGMGTRKTRKGSYEIMEAFLAAGADPDATSPPPLKSSALHFVTCESVARLLISYDANINIQRKNGFTPAHVAVAKQNYGVMRALIAGNANLSMATFDGDTLFHTYSTQLGSSLWTREMVHLLAENGAPMQNYNQEGETPLTKFLKKDMELTLRSRDEFFSAYTRRHERLKYGNLSNSVYSYMLEAGADVNCPNMEGKTLLHVATSEFFPEVAKWLLDKGANVDALDANEDTPLIALLKQEKWDLLGKRTTASKSLIYPDMFQATIYVLVAGEANLDAVDAHGNNLMYHYMRTACRKASVNKIVAKAIEKTLTLKKIHK